MAERPDIERLSDTPGETHAAAREYCLKMIQHYYGIPYTPKWHMDLDSLLWSAERNWFSSFNRGGFWLATQNDTIVGSIGVYRLPLATTTAERLQHRYLEQDRVCQVVRCYIYPSSQSKGIGTQLVLIAQAAARSLGYDTLYLHADANSENALGFWTRNGFEPYSDGKNGYIDFDRPA